jgi:transcriptional regulator CtsR
MEELELLDKATTVVKERVPQLQTSVTPQVVVVVVLEVLEEVFLVDQANLFMQEVVVQGRLHFQLGHQPLVQASLGYTLVAVVEFQVQELLFQEQVDLVEVEQVVLLTGQPQVQDLVEQ